MNDKRVKYIVIRVSNVDTTDVTDEVTTVLATMGHVWFGKYGRPLKAVSAKDRERSRIVLLQKDNKKSTYVAKTFMLTGFSRLPPKDRVYPAYYEKVLGKIRTWLRLERAPKYEQVVVDDLVVASSGAPLSHSLRSSMSSNFVCHLKDGVLHY